MCDFPIQRPPAIEAGGFSYFHLNLAFPCVSSYQSSSLGSKIVVIGVLFLGEMRSFALFHRVISLCVWFFILNVYTGLRRISKALSGIWRVPSLVRRKSSRAREPDRITLRNKYNSHEQNSKRVVIAMVPGHGWNRKSLHWYRKRSPFYEMRGLRADHRFDGLSGQQPAHCPLLRVWHYETAAVLLDLWALPAAVDNSVLKPIMAKLVRKLHELGVVDAPSLPTRATMWKASTTPWIEWLYYSGSAHPIQDNPAIWRKYFLRFGDATAAKSVNWITSPRLPRQM